MQTSATPKLPPRGAAYVQARLTGVPPLEAAERAGFERGVATEAAERMEAHPAVRAHIRIGKLKELDDSAILLFWAETMQNAEAEMPQRLKASELLARSRGMLTDKVRLEGSDGGPVVFAINGIVKE